MLCDPKGLVGFFYAHRQFHVHAHTHTPFHLLLVVWKKTSEPDELRRHPFTFGRCIE